MGNNRTPYSAGSARAFALQDCEPPHRSTITQN